MAETTWASFLTEVRPHLAMAPDPLLEREVRNAAIVFCERSYIYQRDLDPITLAANVPEYDLSPPSGTVVADILSAKVDGEPIEAKGRDELDGLIQKWETDKGTPRYYFQSTLRMVRVVPMPSSMKTNGLTLFVALKPTKASTGIDTAIYEEYVEEIAAGALSTLFMMKDVPWTSAAKASDFRDKFEKGIDAAKVRAARSLSTAPLRVKPYYAIG